MTEKLTPKQKAFADYYIETGNATEAARRAGYKCAEASGKDNIRNHTICEYIAERQGKIEATRLMTLEDIQAFRTRVILGEEKDAFDMDVSVTDKLKAANDLEKALKIKEEHEEKKRIAEEVLKRKTYRMDLYNIPDVFHPVIRDVRDKKHMEYVLKGGRGSTKSSTVAMTIVELLRNYHDIHAVVCRKVGNTIKDSVYNKIKWAIGKQEFTEEFDSKLSPLEITLKATGQKIYFRGADDPDKIKSINPEFGYIGILWFEELDQFAGQEEIRKIEQSAIRGGELAWIFKSFNPPKTKNNWANKYVLEPKENRVVHSSTYHDVPPEWLGKPFLDEAEHLKEVNPSAYEHEYGGEANGNGGNVFEYLEIRDITDEEISNLEWTYGGTDWGFYPDPLAYVHLSYVPRTETIYILDEYGVNRASNRETAEHIISMDYWKYYQYGLICDSSEPKSIQDYVDLGIWNAKGAYKPPDSVSYSMKWLARRKIVIDPKRTPKAYKEITEYEFARDKDGNVISGYPDENNHFIDAIRYALNPVIYRRTTQA